MERGPAAPALEASHHADGGEPSSERAGPRRPMESEAPTEAPVVRRSKRRARAVLGVLGTLVIGFGVALNTPAFTPNDGEIARGVFVGDVDLGGLGADEARARIEEFATAFEHREVRLVVDAKETLITAGQLGVRLDVEATLASAQSAARDGGLAGLERTFLRARTEIPLAVTLDEGAFTEALPSVESVLVPDAPFDGAIHIEDGMPVGEVPRRGHRVDAAALMADLAAGVTTATAPAVTVPLVEVVPPLSEADVLAKVAQARAILSGPITLTYEPPEALLEQLREENLDAEKRFKEETKRVKTRMPKKKSRMKRKGRRLVDDAPRAKPDTLPLPETVEVTFTREDLLLAFRARRVDVPTPSFVVELDDAEVKRKLAPVVSKLYNAARDARFDIDEQNRVTIQKSRPGTRVVASKLVDALYAAAQTPDRRGELPVDNNAEPQFTTAAAEALGITGLVSEYTTHHVCCQPRVKNIHRICDMMNGTIVKAGDTLSVNSAVGPRTTERGFLVAPSIGDGEMTETPGGGVSQFATTLYNAIFNGGYVIRERKPHSFYFSRYPMGIEATLSYPSPDLVFMNDTKAAVLLRCDYSDTFIRVRLFGDNGGRHVDRDVSQPFAYTEPRIEYLAKRTLEPDEEKVKDRGSHGFSIITTRRITEGSGDKRVEKRTVKYTGKPRVVEVHPCKIPKGEKGHTGEKCPEPVEPETEGTAGDEEKAVD